MPSGDLSYRLFLTQRFFDDLIALLGVPSTRFGHRFLPAGLQPPVYGHLTLTYPVFRICWDTTLPLCLTLCAAGSNYFHRNASRVKWNEQTTPNKTWRQKRQMY